MGESRFIRALVIRALMRGSPPKLDSGCCTVK